MSDPWRTKMLAKQIADSYLEQIENDNGTWFGKSFAPYQLPPLVPTADVELAQVIPSLMNLVEWPCEHGPPNPPAVLVKVIIHLNDSHKWSRERIADWLETLDVDLTFAATNKGD